ncbi:MAG: App1 family protein [Candidatus Cyclobacteriaceae bacterium M2_1C_046]
MTSKFRKFIKFANHPLASFGLKVKQKLNLLSPPAIIPYRGYGNRSYAHVKGHVLENKLIYESKESDKKRKNIIGMLGRYMSSQIPGVRIQATFEGQTLVAETNENGYFEMDFHFETPIANAGWRKIQYEVLDKITEDQEDIKEEGEVYIQEDSSRFGIITDIDDTVLISRATSMFKKLWLILTKNSKTRLPFTGVSEFYNELHIGAKGDFTNPVFYVSSSEWNLYDFLEDFAEVRDLPKGVFLLQELKTSLIKLIKSGGGTHMHKEIKIKDILKTYNLPFILIGDSGQKDAEIYARIANGFPGRIKAIYIRDVKKSRGEQVREIADGVKEIDMLLVKTTKMAHDHAKENGFIR